MSLLRITGLLWLLLSISATALPSQARAQQSDEAKTWDGMWSNRKFNTSGPLKCTATRKDDGSNEARFEGSFMGSPFSYTVAVTATPKGDRTLLEGTSTIDGDRYEWSGYVRGGVLYGQYRSQKGNNGEFRLREEKK
jgi:hypothetical protein